MKAKTIAACAVTLGFLSACGAPDTILPGDRTDIRAGFATGEGRSAAPNQARPIALAPAQARPDWTQWGDGPAHDPGHPALDGALALAFAADIGQGDTRRTRITASPVVANGRVFTLDSANQVTATSTGGATLWRVGLTPGFEGTADASGGGLAFADGRLFVSTRFGDLVALDPATGRQFWTQNLDAPGAAPTVVGDLVYVVSRDGRGWAIDRDTGRIRWTLTGTPSVENFAAGSAVAVSDDIAVFPFSSGELVGVFPQGGLRRWSTVVAGQRPGRAAATVSDIAGDPVISGGRVYAGNVSGRVVAVEAATGDRIWTVEEGATGPLWLAGGSLFFVSDLGQLVRLDAGSGEVIWRVSITPPEQAAPRRGTVGHYGPVLAGGRLLVASSDGLLRQFDPVSGRPVGAVEIPGGAAADPAVAGGTLYVVNTRGQLLAFR